MQGGIIRTKWSKKNVEWEENGIVHISCVFTWNLEKARARAQQVIHKGGRVMIGGPAVLLHPDVFDGFVDPQWINADDVNALPHHHPDATFTSRGCVRKCRFCAVPKIEGDLVELDDWEPKPIVCDNNLLACSRVHFDKVVDRLKPISGIDFNQGLDARLLTKYHADRIAELDMHVVRLAWDHTRDEQQFMAAYQKLMDTDIKPGKVRVYVLIGFNDTPDDALYRLMAILNLGSFPNPMRYQPLDARKRNEYVAPGWTEHELRRYMRYWARLNWTRSIPFEEFDLHYRRKTKENQEK